MLQFDFQGEWISERLATQPVSSQSHQSGTGSTLD